jgi:hypothetical protein
MRHEMKRPYLSFLSRLLIATTLLLMSLSSLSLGVQSMPIFNGNSLYHTISSTEPSTDDHASKHAEKIQCHEHYQSNNCHSGGHSVMTSN